jgi:hypothetical protein
MKRSKEEKRRELIAKAEQVVDEYLAWEEGHPHPDLTEIEEIALILRKTFGREIAQMAIGTTLGSRHAKSGSARK